VLKGHGLTERNSPVEFVAVPYYAWQNRGIDEMIVWIVEDPNVLSSDGGSKMPMKNPDPANLVTMGDLIAGNHLIYERHER
jgi:hypothetical protein